MAIAKLKNGETLELPFEEMIDYIAQNPDAIQGQYSEVTMPKRRSHQIDAPATSR
jgi:hypothetical protein